MGQRGAEAVRLTQRVRALISSVSGMKSEYPLKPVWGGLPRGDQDGRIVDEPPVYEEAEREILALREPLSGMLKDTKRLIADVGMPDQMKRFRANMLVQVAFDNGAPGRRGYTKVECVADLQSILKLVQTLPLDGTGARTTVLKVDDFMAGPGAKPKGGTGAVEAHYSVKQLSELWGFSERTLRWLIEDEPELVTIRRDSRNKRTYRRVQVPASVAERIHRKLTAGRH